MPCRLCMIFTAAGSKLRDLLSYPDGWEIGSHVARHAPSGTSWWVCNGPFFFDGYENTPKCLGRMERHLLWFRYKRLASKVIAKKLEVTDLPGRLALIEERIAPMPGVPMKPLKKVKFNQNSVFKNIAALYDDYLPHKGKKGGKL